MEFFIALFGGIFLLAKFAFRKSKENEITRKDQRWEASRQPLTERLKATEEDDAAVSAMKSWSSEDLYALLEDDLTEIFGEGFRDVVPLDNPKCRDFRPFSSPYTWRGKREVYTREAYLSYWITHLLYAKRGKLRTLYGTFDLNVSVGNPEINIRMCEAIQRNLRENGTDVHLEVELEPGIADRSRKYLRGRVLARETQHRYWEGRPLESIRELNPCKTDVPRTIINRNFTE